MKVRVPSKNLESMIARKCRLGSCGLCFSVVDYESLEDQSQQQCKPHTPRSTKFLEQDRIFLSLVEMMITTKIEFFGEPLARSLSEKCEVSQNGKTDSRDKIEHSSARRSKEKCGKAAR